MFWKSNLAIVLMLYIFLNLIACHSSLNKNDSLEEEYFECDSITLGSFLRTFDRTSILPKDYDEIVESMKGQDIYEPIKHINDSVAILDRIIDYGRDLSRNKDLIDSFKYVLAILGEKSFEAQLSGECTADLIQIMNAARNGKIWAFKFPDSFGHLIPSGLLRGHVASFGEFDQCIGIKSEQLENGNHIYGKYCQVQLRSFFPRSYDPSYENTFRQHPHYKELMNLLKKANLDNYLQVNPMRKLLESLRAINYNFYNYAVCFPHRCTTSDIENIFNVFFYPITKIPIKVDPLLCTEHREIRAFKLDKQQWLAIVSLASLSCLVLMSSFYDFFFNHSVQQMNNQNNSSQSTFNMVSIDLKSSLTSYYLAPKKPYSLFKKIILAFSAIQNSRILFEKEKRFSVLDTLKLLLTFGVYSLQMFNFQAMFTFQMLRSITDTVPFEFLSHNAYWFARAPGYFIDGFTFILGVMLMTSQLKTLEKSNGKFNYFMYMARRWIRLSVAMLGILFMIFLLPLVGEGPFWFVVDQWLLPPCKNTSSIVSSFLYYSNWNAVFDNYQIKSTLPICNIPTWFLSMSTQLYALAPLVFLPLYRWPSFGLIFLSLTIIMSPLLTISPKFFGAHTYLEIPKIDSLSESIRAFLFYHTNPCQYITSLTIGMLTGYLIKFKPNLPIFGGKIVESVLWVISFATIPVFYLWNNRFWDLNKINSEWEVLSWFVLSKLVTGLSLSFITYMCSTGRAERINRFLSVSCLQPISKLSYSIYLLRMPTIFYRIANAKHEYEMRYFQTFQNILIDYSITAVLAYFLFILFESPAINLIKIFENSQNQKLGKECQRDAFESPVILNDKSCK